MRSQERTRVPPWRSGIDRSGSDDVASDVHVDSTTKKMMGRDAVDRGDSGQPGSDAAGISGHGRLDENGGGMEPAERSDRTDSEVAARPRFEANHINDGDSSSDGEFLSPEEWRRRQQAFIAELPTSDTGRRTPDVMTDEEGAWDLSDDDVSTSCTHLSIMEDLMSSDEEDGGFPGDPVTARRHV